MFKRRQLLIVTVVLVSIAVVFFFTSAESGGSNGFRETHGFTVEFHGGTDLTPFQGRLFHIGGKTFVDGEVNRSYISLKKGNFLNIRLLVYPSNVSIFLISENHLFLTEKTLGLLDSRKITRTFLMSFPASYDGDFSLDLGVIDSAYYDFRDSRGLWMFEVTIV